MWIGHGTCTYIDAYINKVVDSVMLQLYLQNDFIM
jgi:hypothetical protein